MAVVTAIVFALLLVCAALCKNVVENAPYRWEVALFDNRKYPTTKIFDANLISRGRKPAEVVPGVTEPVYLSLTSISSRMNQLHKTVTAILNGTVLPDHIYIFISKEGFLLDKGIANDKISSEMIELTRNYPVSLVYTNNTGSHRKLLPLLQRKWEEDCVIITIDDEDKRGLDRYIEQLLRYYMASGKQAVVGLKVRRMGVCDRYPHDLAPYRFWGDAVHGSQEMLVLPTGTGGVLYRPRFFHPIVFHPAFRNATFAADDLAFRIGTLLRGVPVMIGCRRKFVTHDNGTVSIVECPHSIEISHSLIAPTEGAIVSTKTGAGMSRTDSTGSNRKKKDKRGVKRDGREQQGGTADSTALGRRQLSSLFSTFNYAKGNDVAWSGAWRLAQLLVPTFNLTDQILSWLPQERKACFARKQRNNPSPSTSSSSTSSSSGTSSAADASWTNSDKNALVDKEVFYQDYAVSRKRSRHCMLSRCR